MQAQVKTWGNSQGIRLSKEILQVANMRGYKKVDKLLLADIINITDAIQGIFDYI